MSDPSLSSSRFTDLGIPTHIELIFPVLQALEYLGGSARSTEITEHILETYPGADVLISYRYPDRPDKSVFKHRIEFARSSAKLIGATEAPSRGMALLTSLGETFLSMDPEKANNEIHDRFRRESKKRRDLRKIGEGQSGEVGNEGPLVAGQVSNEGLDDQMVPDDVADDDIIQDFDWKTLLLDRLHQLPPEGFEKFVIYLLRRHGLQLQHTGRGGDEGVDAIGTAPLSSVLSSRVAVQIKRHAPDGKPIGRETVALFQRDAQTKGAERAILVTLSRFTEPARKAAIMTTPTVDLINGDKLAELIRDDGQSGVFIQPTVDVGWFSKFEK